MLEIVGGLEGGGVPSYEFFSLSFSFILLRSICKTLCRRLYTSMGTILMSCHHTVFTSILNWVQQIY